MFPHLPLDRVIGYINLNEQAVNWRSARGVSPDTNPLLDPRVSDEMVQAVHRAYGVLFTYGGWLEDRSVKLKGTYLDASGNYVHLGIDVNVPAGTLVALDHIGEVVHISDDHPEEGGWGPRVIVRLLEKPVYLVYGHLDYLICHVGDILTPNMIFAECGSSVRNGGWFPHVHVQVIPAYRYEKLALNDFRDLDGYGHPSDIDRLARENPDPLQYVDLRV